MILRKAVCQLSEVLSSIRVSSLYKTRAQDFIDQDDFYNIVVSGWTSSSPEELHMYTSLIEVQYGRNREIEISKGPRTLDIDIEIFGTRVIETRNLRIPHERMMMRQFVLVPLIELLPYSADCVTGRLYREVCENLPDQGILKAGSLHGN